MELSKNNFIAGLLYNVAIGGLIAGGLRLQTDFKLHGLIALISWAVVLVMHVRPRKTRAVGVLLSAFIALGGLARVVIRGYARVPFYYAPQYSLSKGIADILHLGAWPDFVFFTIEAVLDGADQLRPSPVYEMVLLFIIYGAGGWILYALLRKRVHYSVYLLPIGLFIQQWFLYAEHIQGLFVIYFLAFVLIAGEYSRMKYYEMAAGAASGRQHFRNNRYGIYLFTVGLIILLTSQVVLYLIPIESINRLIGEQVPNVMDMRTGYKRASMQLFSFEQMAYQPHKERLGGSVDLSENPVLFKVWSDRPSLYLRGRVKTRYTGSTWTNAHRYYKNNDAYRLKSADTDLYEVTVVPEAMQTRTLFVPLDVYEVALEAHKVFTNPDGAMYYKRESFEQPLGVYTLRGGAVPFHIEDEALYLELPDTFDTQIIDLSLALTADYAKKDEKMLALQSYLREHYSYDLKPGLPPADMDFVSYFLTEGKRGYCTYFASALATMGRAAGIPTRYVEGVLLPQTQGTDGAYTVRADRAHAWVEAYIEGKWVIYEATPAYNAQGIGRVRDRENQTQDSETETSAGEHQLNLMDKEALMDEPYFEAGSDQNAGVGLMRGYLYATLAGLILLCGLVATILIIRTQRYFRRGSIKGRALRLVYYLEDLLGDPHPGQTPYEKVAHYMQATSENPWEDTPLSYDIINWIERALYSAEALELHELVQLEEAVKILERKLGKQTYRFVYYYRQRHVSN